MLNTVIHFCPFRKDKFKVKVLYKSESFRVKSFKKNDLIKILMYHMIKILKWISKNVLINLK